MLPAEQKQTDDADELNPAQSRLFKLLESDVDVRKDAVRVFDESDKRRDALIRQKLENDHHAHKDKHGLNEKVINRLFIAGAALLLILIGVFYMAFFGDGGQKETALAILKTVFIGIGGYGVVAAFSNLYKKLTDSKSD